MHRPRFDIGEGFAPGSLPESGMACVWSEDLNSTAPRRII